MFLKESKEIPRRLSLKSLLKFADIAVVALEPTTGNDKNRRINTATRDVRPRSMSVRPFAAFAEVIADSLSQKGSPIAAFAKKDRSLAVRSPPCFAEEDCCHPLIVSLHRGSPRSPTRTRRVPVADAKRSSANELLPKILLRTLSFWSIDHLCTKPKMSSEPFLSSLYFTKVITKCQYLLQ
ncbi:MAG: hypothetical protein GY847_19220 [Proteobacteria bacterium]|nr:hypothetical protein [Pseudomonadota bacterium]